MALKGEVRKGGRQPASPPVPRLPSRFVQTVERIEKALARDLDGWLPRVPAGLGEAIRYSLLGPGKRLRPVLLLWSAELSAPEENAKKQRARRGSRLNEEVGHAVMSGEISGAMSAAVAIEMLHTYSLVHDDLPAMDDDELRRGRPTCHVAFGEGLAVLAGDALLTRAFEVLAASGLPADRVAGLVRALADGGGAAGMIGGQAEDLVHEHAAGDREVVEYIHEHKTAALFASACRMGAIAAGAAAAIERTLGRYGRCLGMAFQIADDLLDETAATQQLGKRAGKDRSAGKLTYPAVAGIEASREAAQRWIGQAESVLAELSGQLGGAGARQPLIEAFCVLGRYVIERSR